MFKFLRKYNKWILAVGGTLLMIVFLVPQAVSSLSQRAAVRSGVWATVGPDAAEVSAETRRQCENELRVLENIQRQSAGPASTDRPEHWYLLLREAEQNGLVGGLASDQLTPDQMQTLATVIGSTPLADRALGNRMAIDKMVTMYLQSPKLSDTRLRRQAERMFHSVDARFVILEARASDDIPAPSETQIREQYEKYRDVAPRTPDAPVVAGAPTAAPDEESDRGFGYKLPDRFKLEWLRIEAGDVEAMIEAGDELEGVALYKHWESNVTAKGFPPYPAEGEDVPEAPEIVRTDLLRELTTERLADIERFVNDKLFATWRRLRVIDGYRELPDGWESARVDLEAVAREIQNEFPGLELPAYRAVRDRWLRVEDVNDLEGLSDLTTDRYSNTRLGLAGLIAAAKEFGGDPVILTQVGVADLPLRDRNDDSLVFFRILEADPSRPPRDVSEVRDEVVRDLKRKAEYQRLLAMKDSIEAAARNEGLLAVAIDNDVAVEPVTQVHIDSPSLLTFQLQNNFTLARMSSLPVLGAHAATVERIVDHAMSLPRDKKIADLPVEDRVFALAVDDRMTLVVVEMLRQEALSNDGFKRIAALGLDRVILGEEQAEAEPPVEEVFGYDALAARHNFRVKRRETDDENPEAGDDQATPVADAGADSEQE